MSPPPSPRGFWHTTTLTLLTLAASIASASPTTSPSYNNNNIRAVPDVCTDSNTNWHKYVRSPTSSTLKPVAIIADRTQGRVTNPKGLIDGTGGPTVFSRDANNTSDVVPTVVLDFGQNVVGLLGIRFAGSSGTNKDGSLPGVRLAFSETLQFLSSRSDFSRSYNAGGKDKLTDGSDQIAVKNEAYNWKDYIGCQHDTKVCADGLHGFRYVRISLDAIAKDAPYTTPFGSVSISSVNLEWSAYLGTPDTFSGWFECSDKDLTQWWYDGVYTVDTNTDFFFANETEPRRAASKGLEGKQVLMDGAKRDRDPYVGDLAVASLTSYLSHDFAEASRTVLEDLANHQRDDGWIPPASINDYTLPLFDYPLWWVVCSVDLVMYTGDTAYANKYWSVLVKTLDKYYPSHTNTKTNLVDKKAEIGYGDYAFLPRSGPITYYNALYIHALSYAAQLADTLGKKEDATRWNTRAGVVRAALMKNNFDEKVGAFYDGGPCPGQPAGTYCDVHAQDGNSIAILAGVTDDKTSRRILDYWGSKAARPYGNAFYDSDVLAPSAKFSSRVYAFMSYFELAARFGTEGTPASGFDEIRRLYGWMATHDPKITHWEGIGPNGAPYQGTYTSMSHGWSTGVTPILSNFVLGVKPTRPGFSRWEVNPVVEGGGLTWAKGVVPTPHGGLGVCWRKDATASGSGTVFTLRISAPNGTEGKVRVPVSGFASRVVKVNGKTVVVGDKEAFVTVDVKAGSHTITVGA